jgi:hypothetical protein
MPIIPAEISEQFPVVMDLFTSKRSRHELEDNKFYIDQTSFLYLSIGDIKECCEHIHADLIVEFIASGTNSFKSRTGAFISYFKIHCIGVEYMLLSS